MLIVFGSINADLLLEVDRLPRPGETVSAQSCRWLPGGKGANQATAAAKAGARVRLFGAVGRDPYGPSLRRGLEEAGVDTRGVREVDGPSGVAVVAVERGGENLILVASGANAAARADQLNDRDLAPGAVLLCQNELPAAETFALLIRAHRRGLTAVLNLAPATVPPAEVLEAVDVLVVNEGELGLLAGSHEVEEGARSLARRFALTAVVTLGARGAFAVTEERLVRVAALPVQAVDTTGAGDAFVGVLAAALAEGRPLEDGLRRASVAAGLTCTRLGAQEAQPRRAEIEARIAELPPPQP